MSGKTDEFERWKNQTLARFDRSNKGSVDILIVGLIEFINKLEGYCTTSSCSGRICVLSDNSLFHSNPKTKNCVNYLMSHERVTLDDVLRVLPDISSSSKLKFEGFVMHVRCRSIDDARKLQSIAVAAGFRNSGLSLGRKGLNIIAAVRGTYCLEVPLTDQLGQVLVSHEYIDYVVRVANAKMDENCRRIANFTKEMEKVFRAAS